MILNACVLSGKMVDEKVCKSCTRVCRHAGEPTTRERLDCSYYKTAFEKLIEAGVPRWYIRLYLLTDLIYFSEVYVYYNPYDIETQYGWYATNGLSLVSTEADRNRKCYGELKNMGFPTWDEYKTLFDGDEYDCTAGFMDAYDRHREEWLQAQDKESHINYAD